MADARSPHGAAKQPPATTDMLSESDWFRIYACKILPCGKRYCHDWSDCAFAHSGEKIQRRCPRTFLYGGVMCPDMKKFGTCPKGDGCSYSHNSFELWLHPSRYRTEFCSYGTSCSRAVCFFAHTEAQLRTPGATTSLAETAADSLDHRLQGLALSGDGEQPTAPLAFSPAEGSAQAHGQQQAWGTTHTPRGGTQQQRGPSSAAAMPYLRANTPSSHPDSPHATPYAPAYSPSLAPSQPPSHQPPRMPTMHLVSTRSQLPLQQAPTPHNPSRLGTRLGPPGAPLPAPYADPHLFLRQAPPSQQHPDPTPQAQPSSPGRHPYPTLMGPPDLSDLPQLQAFATHQGTTFSFSHVFPDGPEGLWDTDSRPYSLSPQMINEPLTGQMGYHAPPWLLTHDAHSGQTMGHGPTPASPNVQVPAYLQYMLDRRQY